jgi:lipopolysaccharide/colanic/teichoic acid biosynthesis glycosyltransferase
MGAWLTLLLPLAIAAAARLLADDLKELVIWSRKRILKAAINKVPQTFRDRYSEEWERDCQDKPGEIARLFAAIGYYAAATGILSEVRAGFQNRFTRKALDELFSGSISLVSGLCLLAIAAPLMLMLAVFVSRTGPVFYVRRYVGKGGCELLLPFYRVFIDGPQGGRIKIPAWGVFMRRSDLDNLPMIISLLRGDIALVGPRPRVAEDVSKLREDYRAMYLRLKPGLIFPGGTFTRWWPENVEPSAKVRLADAYEFEYFLHRNVFTDLMLLAKTFCDAIRELMKPI